MAHLLEGIDDGESPEWVELQTSDGLTYFFNTITQETTWERPDALMTDEHKAQAGEWVWLPDDVDCFVPAKVVNHQGQTFVLELQDGRVQTVRASESLVPLRWVSLQRIVPDMVLLDDMVAPLILHNLRKRFEDGKIYTNIGTILISINPYQYLDFYSPENVRKYREALHDHKDMPPHVFVSADDAFKGLTFAGGRNQSIVISGESGAGKTEAAKQCLSYLGAIAGSVSGIEKKVFLSNPILETFGNAKTVRNNNSSRFGKYVDIFFNKDLQMCSSSTTNYLLEKIRVVKQNPGERNYHIFYQLTTDQEMMEAFGLGGPDYFEYTNKSSPTVDGIDDKKWLVETKEAFSALDFTADEQWGIFQIVAAVLHLGNIQFYDTGDRQSAVSNDEALQWAAQTLQVDVEMLRKSLLVKMLRIRGQTPTPVTIAAWEAADQRDALSKMLYSRMFDQIVSGVNRATKGSGGGAGAKSIGILDIFGFEIFEHNSFEQLCINLTNENLQQFFCLNTFKLEEELYRNEGVSVEHVEYIDNQPILDLVSKRPHGLVPMLDEEGIVPQGSEAGWLFKIADRHTQSGYFFQDKSYGQNSFMIVHYAGNVVYDTTGFLDKNKDTLSEDLLELVQSSQLGYLHACFPKAQQMSSRERKRTVGSQFLGQLRELMTALTQTEPHYIRCVKPNENKAPLTFVSQNCHEQLRYSGVYEAVQIRKKGFPFRQTHSAFVGRYECVLGDRQLSRNKQGAQQIVGALQLNEANVRYGRTMVLYRAEEHKSLELKRSIIMERVTMVETLEKLLQKNPESLSESARDPYYEELSRAVRRAKAFKLDHPVFEKARARLFEFIESRIDSETKAMLEAAWHAVDEEQLKAACAVADAKGYNTQLCQECRMLRDRVIRINAESVEAYASLDSEPMRAILQAADRISMTTNYIEHFRWMFTLSKEKFLQEQVRTAVTNGNTNRVIRLQIQLKDLVFEKTEALFQIRKFPRLKSSEDWAGEKLLTFKRAELASSQLVFTQDSIHTSLTELEKPDRKAAQQAFENAQCYAHDRKPKLEDLREYAVLVATLGMQNPATRAEIFLQLVKQLSKNPSEGSKRHYWNLMIVCLSCFAPQSDFENYFEAWLRRNTPDRERFLMALHTMIYNKERQFGPPTVAEIDQMIAGTLKRLPQFTEAAPPGKPTWSDLLIPYQEYYESEELTFTTSQPLVRGDASVAYKPRSMSIAVQDTAVVARHVGAQGMPRKKTIEVIPEEPVAAASASAPAAAWVAKLDASGWYYFENNETGESTWDYNASMGIPNPMADW